MRLKMLSVLLLSLLILSSFGSATANGNKGQQYKVLKILEYRGNRYSIPYGAYILHENGRTLIYDKTHKLIVSVDDDNVQKINVPTRGKVPVTYVYQVPSGAYIRHKTGRIKVIYNGETILTIINKHKQKTLKNENHVIVPDFNGWIEQANDWSVSEITYFSAYWDVPSPPSTTRSVIFLFPAIEPSDGSAIIQPVLEWNRRGAPKWTIASWYGSNGDYFYSTPIDVSVGDTIHGIMDWHENLAMWSVETCDETTSKCTTLYTDIFGPSGDAVFIALEGYYIADKKDLPGDTYFYRIQTYNSNGEFYPDWKPVVDQTAQQVVGGGLDVEIHYYYGETGIWLLTPN